MAGEEGHEKEVKGLLGLDSMAKIWSDLRAQNQFVDATLVSSDNVTFPVHRVILSGCSKFFSAIFTNPMRVDEQNKVHLQNVNSSEMGVLLRYIYDRELEITNDNVFKLLHASDYLSFLDVHKACVDFLKNSLTPVNCLTIRVFARNHFLEDLEAEAQMYLLRNFPAVAEHSQEILTLPLDELVPILASDLLNVRNEEMVWRLVLRWVNHDKEERLHHLVVLLQCIRLGLMEVQYFLEHVKNHPYILGNEVCRPVIIDTLKVLMDVETITQKDGMVQTPECARPRIPHEVLFAIGGWSGGSPTNAVETYDTRADRWIRVEEVDPSGPRAYHGTAVIGSEIYVIGGFDGMENFNSCRCFDAQHKTWKEIAPMHERRCYVSVVVLDKVIYAMGGYNGHHRQNTAEKYDYKTNQWTMIAPMHVQRSDACATVLNDKIYITGGFDGRECLSSAEVYDPSNNTWTLLPPMRSRRSGVSCIAYHDSVYVLGGFNGVTRMCSVEKFSPATNLWTAVPDMYTTRSNFAIEVIDDMVFAIGGFNGLATIHQVECFDDRTNEWAARRANAVCYPRLRRPPFTRYVPCRKSRPIRGAWGDGPWRPTTRKRLGGVWYEATDMNVFRSALSACVVADLPNTNDYIHQNRHMLMEEKRQKLLALSRGSPANNEENPAILNITQAIEEVNNAVFNADQDQEQDAVVADAQVDVAMD